MRAPLIAGNWKMHGDSAFVAEYGTRLAAAGIPPAVEVLVFPPIPYLRPLANALGGGAVGLGVQNVHAEAEGAFTGEVAAEMARDLGAAWALVGHSERRTLFGETDEAVALKVQACLRAGLTPVLCVGETLAERDAGSAEAVVARQIQAVAQAVGPDGLAAAVVAYEPVWAIGTGRTATPEQAQDMHRVIRERFAAACGDDAAAGARILYGGSVKADNAAALLAQPDIDGALVGGASLQAAEFARIAGAAATSGDEW
ncbi:MAG: triose-phosphate isomerase [Pseudomonadota bacterium]